jgi:glycosyltransferase involved in cell wall biosynthesis
MQNRAVQDVSIVLPAYNEEAVISETLGRIFEYIGAQNTDFEIIVVNDGSADRTHDIVAGFRSFHPQLKLVDHPKNKGYGEALRSGFDAATKDWIFLMDSDGQFDITELDNLAEYASANDMVLGYRARRADSWHRVFFGWGYTTLMNMLFGMKFKDIDCAFKLFRRSAWQAAKPVKSSDHKMFTVEWLWHSKKAGLRIKELPVNHYPRIKGKQTGARADVIWQMLRALVKLRFR